MLETQIEVLRQTRLQVGIGALDDGIAVVVKADALVPPARNSVSAASASARGSATSSERRGLLERRLLAVYPRGVSYQLSPAGASLVKILDQLELWSKTASFARQPIKEFLEQARGKI